MRGGYSKYGLDTYGTHKMAGNESENIFIWMERAKVGLMRMDCMWAMMGFCGYGQECKLGCIWMCANGDFGV